MEIRTVPTLSSSSPMDGSSQTEPTRFRSEGNKSVRLLGNDIHLFTFFHKRATYTRNIRAVVRVLHLYTRHHPG